MRYRNRLAALLVFAALFSLATRAALGRDFALTTLAQSSKNPCVGVDLVLVIDQSNSMATSDEGGFRILAAREVIKQLGYNRIFVCPDIVHRIASISFGDDGQPGDGSTVDLPFRTLEPSDARAWLNESAAIGNILQPQQKGGTDFATALAVAKQQLDGLPPLGEAKRHKAMILLTDGEPCVVELGCNINPALNLFDTGGYVRNLEGQITNDFSFTPEEGVYFWVVALRNDSGTSYLDTQLGNGTLREFWTRVAQARGGDLLSLSKNDEALPAEVSKILNSFTGTGDVELTGCTQRYIDPFTERVVFTIFKGSGDLSATIEHPFAGGKLVLAQGIAAGGNADIALYDNNDPRVERYVINLPDPGLWFVNSPTCDRLQVLRELIDPEALLIEPAQSVEPVEAAPFYDQRSPTYLTYEIRNRGVTLPAAQGSFNLSLTAEITPPSGKSYTRSLTANGKTFRSTEPLLVGEVGLHKVMLTGTTQSADPANASPVVVFTSENLFKVEYVQRQAQIQVLAPKAGAVIPTSNPKTGDAVPTTFRVQLQATDGKVLDPARVFSTPPADGLEATVSGASNATVELRPAAEDSSIYTGQADLPEGNYTLQVRVRGTYPAERYQFAADTVTVPFQVVKAQFFSFDVVAPAAGAESPLNAVTNGQQSALPLDVRVRIVDAGGQGLDTNQIFAPNAAQILSATLQGPNGASLPITLAPDAARLGEYVGQTPAADQPGDYTLSVGISAAPTNVRYQLSDQQTKTVTFKRVRVEPIRVRIVEPTSGTTVPLYKPWLGAFLGQSEAVRVVVELTDEQGTTILDPRLVLGSDLKQAISAVVFAPDGVTRTLTLNAVDTPAGQRIEGVTTDLPAVAGAHNVTARVQQVRPSYAPIAPEAKQEFTRGDSSWTRSRAIMLPLGSLSLLLLAVAVFLTVWTMRTGPRGSVEVLRRRTPIAEATLRPFNRFRLLAARNNELKALGIGAIRAVNNTEDPDESAINVWVYDNNGALMGFSGERLVRGQQGMDVPGESESYELRYQ